MAPQVGKFQLLDTLGSGGMATVYLARAEGESNIALKLVHPHLKSDPSVALQFIQEAKLAAQIRHPNVVRVLDLGEDPEGLYLVLEYVEGAAFSRILSDAAARGTTLDPAVGVRVVLDALAGLHAAHELRAADGTPLELVHRDFTPHNVLVGVDGISRLTDFGIARAATQANLTRTGTVKGKVAYMAPEQVRGKDVDRRADVWAAGVVLWEIFAGGVSKTAKTSK